MGRLFGDDIPHFSPKGIEDWREGSGSLVALDLGLESWSWILHLPAPKTA